MVTVATVPRVTAHAELTYLWHEAPVAGYLEVAKIHGFLVCALVQECDGCLLTDLPAVRPGRADRQDPLGRPVAAPQPAGYAD